MKTLQECKDEVASEIIYSRPSNYRQYKGWSDWVNYFHPSTKERDDAWTKAAELYNTIGYKEGYDHAKQNYSVGEYSESV